MSEGRAGFRLFGSRVWQSNTSNRSFRSQLIFIPSCSVWDICGGISLSLSSSVYQNWIKVNVKQEPNDVKSCWELVTGATLMSLLGAGDTSCLSESVIYLFFFPFCLIYILSWSEIWGFCWILCFIMQKQVWTVPGQFSTHCFTAKTYCCNSGECSLVFSCWNMEVCPWKMSYG